MLTLLLSIPDIAGLVGLFLAGIGLIFTAIQLRQNSITRRAQILLTVISQHFSNPEQRALLYELDYHRFYFNPREFKGSENEKALDGILYNFSVAGFLLRTGAILPEEARLLRFEVQRVFDNPEVVRYLDWLDEDLKRIGNTEPPFQDAEYLADQLLDRKNRPTQESKKIESGRWQASLRQAKGVWKDRDDLPDLQRFSNECSG